MFKRFKEIIFGKGKEKIEGGCYVVIWNCWFRRYFIESLFILYVLSDRCVLVFFYMLKIDFRRS